MTLAIERVRCHCNAFSTERMPETDIGDGDFNVTRNTANYFLVALWSAVGLRHWKTVDS